MGQIFSGKAWYDNLDTYLRSDLGFQRSMVEGCLYIYRNQDQWIKLINYVDDALYYFDSEETKATFENKLKNKFNLTLMGTAKWYLGIRITQNEDTVYLDQSQYAKNITSRMEKNFKSPIKGKDSPLPNGFLPTKDDCPKNSAQVEEVKRRFKNLHYRSAIGALLYISCCTRPSLHNYPNIWEDL